MSYVAECETCGVIKRGDLEEVGDAIEDHEQFHDVRIQRVATDGGSKLRCASCRATVTLDDTLELQAPEISDGTIARVRVCEDCRPDVGNKRPVTAYKDLLKTVIKRANGIEEEQATLGEDEWDPETAELRDGETTDIDSHARRNAEHLRMAKEHLEDDDDLATDGGRDQDDTGFFVVNEDRGAVVAGPFDVKETAAEKALDRGPSHIVATEAVLEMIEVTSSTTIRWENEDVDVVTDGGQDVRSEWTLICTDCDFEDELVTEGHPREGPPSEVEDRVREHKGTVDWSHVVRVEGRVADEDREIDPSLLTDGGQSVDGTEQTPVKKRKWIAQYLSTVPVVEWDRFVVGEMDGYQYVNVYGWIDRKDEYKDFVWSRFWPANETVEFTTSSDEYSGYLQAEWFGEDTLDDHNPCRRVEHLFDIDNAIKLREDASLNAFSDGGDRDAE